MTMFSPASRGRLTNRDIDRFPDGTLFDRLARTVCQAGCLPRKELYEAWEMARRVRRLFRGGRVARPGRRTRPARPSHAAARRFFAGRARRSTKRCRASSAKLHEVLVAAWPRLSGRIAFVASALDDVEILDTDIVVSSHACGALTDRVLARAAAARARVAVLPCCHDLDAGDDGGLSGWVDGAVAIDIVRAMRLAAAGLSHLDAGDSRGITPKNRLLLGRSSGW